MAKGHDLGPGRPLPKYQCPVPSGFEEGLTVATVVESALCALRNCVAFMPPGKAGLWSMQIVWKVLFDLETRESLHSLLSCNSGTEPSPVGTARTSGVGQQVG